ncbi:MAG: DNA/RNA nuclease SfsA [Proteobacteria bacterium]|nr:DNA/RNA nuclease SfsA [Pseudomonadota bacterium]
MILQDLQAATFIKRYKRFLVDVERADGSVLTVHCPNTGSMRGCLTPGNKVMISCAENPKRKYPHTLEMIEVDGYWVGINTMRTNHLVREALEAGIVVELGRVDRIQAEVKVSKQSRLDFLVVKGNENIYLEVKNCTLVEDAGAAMFPDAVTARGTKHLLELADLVEQGARAMIFFCVQRQDGNFFAPADHIDSLYGKTLRAVVARGVEIVAYEAQVGLKEITIKNGLQVRLESNG